MQRTWTTALIAAAAMAMPVGLATSAEAKTQDRCTIKPLSPKFVGHYPSAVIPPNPGNADGSSFGRNHPRVPTAFERRDSTRTALRVLSR